MKKLLLLGAALLSVCALGQTARAGGDDYEDSYERPAPRYYEGRVVEHRCYVPPPVYIAPPPVVYAYPRPYYHRRHFRHPYGYGYGGYGYGPGVHVGIGF